MPSTHRSKGHEPDYWESNPYFDPDSPDYWEPLDGNPTPVTFNEYLPREKS